jgi:hypothetical protein
MDRAAAIEAEESSKRVLGEQGQVITLIAKYAVVVSLVYSAIYGVLGFNILATCNFGFGLICGMVVMSTTQETVRPRGITLTGSELL